MKLKGIEDDAMVFSNRASAASTTPAAATVA